MKRFCVVLTLTVTAMLWSGAERCYAATPQVSPRQQYEMRVMLDETIIRQDAIERSGKRKRDDQVINEAVDIALREENPQKAWHMIEHSSIGGKEKLELLKLFREIFPGFESRLSNASRGSLPSPLPVIYPDP